jgi:DNA-binding CsgD family transcriptional regulator
MAGMVDRPLAELEPIVEELLEAAFIYPFDYVDQGYYDFRHQLLRDAIYAAMPPSQLRRFHAQAAEFALKLEASNIIHASRHYERAGLRPQAFRASMAGAREASRISARVASYELYRRAVDNMPADLPLAEQADLYAQLAGACSAMEEIDEMEVAAARARQLYLAAGRGAEAADMLLALGSPAFKNGLPAAEVRTYAEQALAEIAELPPSDDRERVLGWALTTRADYRLSTADFEGARADAQAARQAAEQVGDREGALDAELLTARVDIVDGQFVSGLANGLRAARAARDAGFESVGVTGFRNIAIAAARVMDYDAAAAAIREGVEYADAIEQSHCRQQIAVTAALMAWHDGHWAEADTNARQELVERGCRRGVVSALDVIGLVAMGRGQVAEGHRWLDESLAAGRRMTEVPYILPPLWGLAELDLVAGDASAAGARCAEALSLAAATGERALLVPFVVTGVRAWLAAHRPDEAERWLASVAAELRGWESVAAPALAHGRGLVRMATGSLTAARDELETAVHGWTDRHRQWEALWARSDLAQCLLRSNRYAEAAGLIAEVHGTAERLGSEPLLARVAELERIGRGRGSAEELWHPLTAREFEVARLVATGMTNAQIASELTISPKTASAHIEHILAKLGVTRRAEIAAWTATVTQLARPSDSVTAGVGAGRR